MSGQASDKAGLIAHLESLLTTDRVRRMREVLAQRSDQVVFVFERLVHPHNLSAVLRSMDAFSFQDAHFIAPEQGLHFPRGITIGTERWLSLHRHDSTAACLTGLKQAGYRICASLPDSAENMPVHAIDFSQPTALIFGNEHAGVSTEVLQCADARFHIPMQGFVESLNLSVAAGISAFCARQAINADIAADNPEQKDLHGGEGNTQKDAQEDVLEWENRWLLSPQRKEALYLQWLRSSLKRADQITAEFEQREKPAP